MKSVLLIGLGRFGREVALNLSEHRHEIMAVDEVEERVNAVLPFVNNALIGDTKNEEFLLSLGVDNYDLCIVAIGEDFQSSLETTALLKELGANYVVARASSDVHAKFLLKNGADEVVFPEKQLGKWTAIRFGSKHVRDYIEMDDENAIFEVFVPEKWVGKSIGNIDIRKKYNINILGIKKRQKLNVSINADTVFEKDDTLLVLGEYKNVERCFHID